jgi:hypothetical protein
MWDQFELVDCQQVLEMTLDRLDRVGAGIAAIHVDAAIQQLKQNLANLEGVNADGFDPEMICVLRVPYSTH